MKITVVGASLPGMVVADAMASRGHYVTLMGDPDKARTSNPIGPMYLWCTPAVRLYLTKFGVFVADDDVTDRNVIWVDRAGKVAEPDLHGYGMKTGNPHFPRPVCSGRKSFRTINKGFEILHGDLRRRARNFGDLMKSWPWYAKDIRPDYVRIASGTVILHDVLVNTLPLATFETLCGNKVLFPTTVSTLFHQSTVAPVGRTVAGDDDLIYCGDVTVPWFRCTKTGKYWAYESTTEIPGFYGDVRRMEAKIVSKIDSPKRDEVVHVGRWAEQDPEMMVSDVIENVEKYCLDIETRA